MKKTLVLVAFMAFAAPAVAEPPPSQIDTRPNRAAVVGTAYGQRVYNRIVAGAGPRQAVDVGEEAGSKAAAALKGYAGRLDESEIERRGRAAAKKASIQPEGRGSVPPKSKFSSRVEGSVDDFVRGYVAGFAAAVAAAK